MSRHQKIATEFCTLVEVDDLFEYLGLSRDCRPEAAAEALAKKRRYMQAMQANPKYRESARFLIKNHRHLASALSDPAAHLEAMRAHRESEVLPMLEIALNGALSDGRMTAEEERFLRKLAVDFGVSISRYEEVLWERARAHNATIEASSASTSFYDLDIDDVTVDIPAGGPPTSTVRGAEGHGWWGASFTRLLLECIPGGPGELVDIYCRTALSALTLLPERRQLSYLGVDRSGQRIGEARDLVQSEALEHAAKRITLTTGLPHKLPVPDSSVDYVLAVRALANLRDTRPVFREALRVLRLGGRMIVAEPDGFAECFYFDGNLIEYNASFHRLVVAVDRAGGGSTPHIGRSGLAIGPTLSARMHVAGFEPHAVRTHASNNVRQRSFGAFRRRLGRYPRALAARVGLQDSPELAAVETALEDLRGLIPDDHVGMAGHVLPMFVTVGINAD